MTREPTEMELRAAEAFAGCDCLTFAATDAIYQAFALTRVRAVISAMRNPPQELLTTYRRGVDASDPLGPEREIETRLPVEVWNDRIDRMSPPEGT